MFEDARLVGPGLAAYDRGEGRPIVLLPGAWDLAASYRKLAPHLIEAGYRVIAFDLSGHGGSRPSGRAELPARDLAASLDAALEELGVGRALLVGHDLGARVARELAAWSPGRAAGLVSLGMVLSGRAPVDPEPLFRAALGPRFFLLALEARGEIEALLEEDVRKTLAFFHRGAAPGSVPFEGTSYALFDELREFDPASASGHQLHDEAWFERYVAAFEALGFGDALAMLRPITQNWRDEAERPDTLELPVAFVLGEHDALVPPERAEGPGLRESFPRSVVEIIPGAGHFPHLEASSKVSAAVLALAKGAMW